MSNIQHEQPALSMADLQTIFTHFSPQDIEGFYQLYQLWTLQQRREEIIAQKYELTPMIEENEARLKAVSPSTIALATLTQFRASGVEDIDLLDRMLERGDAWLDHTLELFERFEQMNMIQGNAAEWCEHALEGAYEWLESMNGTNEESDSNTSEDDATVDDLSTTTSDQPLSEEVETEALPEPTEADFLQKLMSEDGESQEQPEENEAADEQQASSELEEDVEPAMPSMAIGILEDEGNIHLNSNEDEIVSQENGEEALIPASDDTLLRLATQIEQVITQDEEEDSTSESVLIPVNEYEEIEYAIPTRPSEIQQENEHLETPQQEQGEDSQPTEQEDAAVAQAHTHEEVADTTLDASTEVQQESEPSDITQDEQNETIAPAEQDTIDEDPLPLEDATIAATKEDREDTLETPALDLHDLDTEDVARKDTLEIPSLDLHELDAEDVTREITVETPPLDLYESSTEDVAGKDTLEIPSLELDAFDIKDTSETAETSEPEEEREIPDEDEETQQINVVSHAPTNQDIEAQAAEQQPANVTTEDDHPTESIPSFDEQADEQRENEDLTDEKTAQPLPSTNEIASLVQASTSDGDNTDSLAAIQNDTTETNVQDEQNKSAEYVREVAFAETASELESNIPAGLSAPDIKDILPAATNNELAATPLEDSEPDTQLQTEVETQKTHVLSGQQNKEVKAEEKKPQKLPEPKPRGFLRRLLAKLLHWW